MKKILFLFISIHVSIVSFSQDDKFNETKNSIEQKIKLNLWDDVLLLSADLITADLTKGDGYYFTALAFYKIGNEPSSLKYLEKAKVLADEALLNKITQLENTIKVSNEVETLVRSAEQFEAANNKKLAANTWLKAWNLDKSKIEYALNAVLNFISIKDYEMALSILNQPELINDEIAKQLIVKINKTPEMIAENGYKDAIEEGNKLMLNKNFSNAKIAFETALRYKPNDTYAARKRNEALDEIEWAKVAYTSDEYVAKNFFLNYPNSKYKQMAYNLWQKNFLQYAKKQTDENALEKLNTFKKTFSLAPIEPTYMQQATTLYYQKWNDAYTRYKQEYLTSKKYIRKREGKAWLNTIVMPILMYGVGYGIEQIINDPENNINMGAIMAGTYFIVGISINPPWNAAKYERKRIKVTQQKLNKYSATAVFY